MCVRGIRAISCLWRVKNSLLHITSLDKNHAV
jgi:hypothetical protein